MYKKRTEGSIYKGKDNYMSIKVGKKWIPLQRFIMEEHIGRKLLKSEVVHHINSDPTDNRIDNLLLCSRAEHTRLHKLGTKASDETKERLRLARLGDKNPMFGKPAHNRKDVQLCHI
jgi:hypothetical protein